MIYIIEMIDDLNEVEQDVLEEIDPDLVSYTFSTRGGDQLIYLNKVYQIKKFSNCFWYFCKDREHCRTTVRLLSLRENRLVQADYNIHSLGIEHNALCNVNATTIVIEQFKKDLIERASILHNMVNIQSQQLMYGEYSNLAGEYSNLELHLIKSPYPFNQMYTFSFFDIRVTSRRLFAGIYVLMTHKSTFIYRAILHWWSA